MPLRDYKLEAIKAAKDAIKAVPTAVENQIRKLKPIQASAGSAARYSNIVARKTNGKVEAKLAALKQVDAAVVTGEYTTMIDTNPAFCMDIANYFKSKKFIVVINKEKTKVLVSWIGGSGYKRIYYSRTSKDDYKLVMGKIIKQKVDEEFGFIPNKSRKTNKTPIKRSLRWINPSSPTDDGLYNVYSKLQ